MVDKKEPKHKHEYKYGGGTLCTCGKTKGLR